MSEETPVVEPHQIDENGDNGYVDVDVLMKSEAAAQNEQFTTKPLIETVIEAAVEKVVAAEPDSSSDLLKKTFENTVLNTNTEQSQPQPQPQSQSKQEVQSNEQDKNKCPMKKTCQFTSSVCGLCENVSTYFNEHQCVKSFLLWDNPKLTGAVLVTSLILVELFARNSLLYTKGALALLLMTITGTYRLYLVIMNRVKGVEDQTFTKLASHKIQLSHEQIQTLASFVETHGNIVLNRLKLILLWDNVYDSAVAYCLAYVLYSLGSYFNTLTLLSMFIVDVFTLPKIYTVYKVQIDSGLMKGHNVMCDVVAKVQDKLPMLFKRKTQ